MASPSCAAAIQALQSDSGTHRAPSLPADRHSPRPIRSSPAWRRRPRRPGSGRAGSDPGCGIAARRPSDDWRWRCSRCPDADRGNSGDDPRQRRRRGRVTPGARGAGRHRRHRGGSRDRRPVRGCARPQHRPVQAGAAGRSRVLGNARDGRRRLPYVRVHDGRGRPLRARWAPVPRRRCACRGGAPMVSPMPSTTGPSGAKAATSRFSSSRHVRRGLQAARFKTRW